MKETTLYLIDDHQIIIDGLQLLIGSEPNYKIIGSANDGIKACSELLSKKPDIALVDLKMPGMEGIQLIAHLKKKINTKFVVLSMYKEKRYISDAISYGASGYLLKNTDKKELMYCLTKVSNGEKYFPQKNSFTSEEPSLFTPRELEILKLVINENTTQDIARELHLSPYTVETHRKNICRKANTRTVIGLSKFLTDNEIEL